MVALLVMAGSAVFVFVPGVHDKAENGLLRLQSWWQEQQPHEMYVPPPPEMTDEPVALSTPVATPTPTIHPGSENSATNATATPTTRPTSTAKPGVAVAPASPQKPFNGPTVVALYGVTSASRADASAPCQGRCEGSKSRGRIAAAP